LSWEKDVQEAYLVVKSEKRSLKKLEEIARSQAKQVNVHRLIRALLTGLIQKGLPQTLFGNGGYLIDLAEVPGAFIFEN
jgi:hypothetical protein